MKLSSWSVSICSLAASMPSAMGRSKLGPSFFTSAGARLMVVRPMGNLKPELVSAVVTRSRDSFTAASGRPTMTMTVSPQPALTSTSTGYASMPLTAAEQTLESMGELWPRLVLSAMRLSQSKEKEPRPQKVNAVLKKNWRQPTLAEAIQPLPSARQCLTAVFGMGTGRTTASWPPKNVKDRWRYSLKTNTQEKRGITCTRVKTAGSS